MFIHTMHGYECGLNVLFEEFHGILCLVVSFIGISVGMMNFMMEYPRFSASVNRLLSINYPWVWFNASVVSLEYVFFYLASEMLC